MAEAVYWPSWRHGPNGQQAIFNSPEDVPVGWFETREAAEAHEAANVAPPENGGDFWGGYSKEYLTQLLRKSGQKVHANMSARKAFEKCEELSLFEHNAGEKNAE